MKNGFTKLAVYRAAMDVGAEAASLVAPWDLYTRDLIARKIIRTADAVAAHLAEDNSRAVRKRRRQFCQDSPGLTEELRCYLKIAAGRNLLDPVGAHGFAEELDFLKNHILAYLNSVGRGPSSS